MELRRLLVTKDVVYSEAGKKAPRPITRAIAIAVIRNPFAGRHVEDLSPLFDIGAQLAELVMPQLVALLPNKAESYGKGAIVGVDGDLEHAPCLQTLIRDFRCEGGSEFTSNAVVAQQSNPAVVASRSITMYTFGCNPRGR